MVKFGKKREIYGKIVDDVAEKWKGAGKKVDEDLMDVIDDILEDNPNFFKGIEDEERRPRILKTVLDELL